MIELRHYQGLSYADIAATLDLPLSDVKSHLFRARRALAARPGGAAVIPDDAPTGAAGWPRRDRIAFAGHSQGGGHAAMTAKLQPVARAILFDATEPRAWTTEPFATAADRLYGFAHELEPIFAPIARSWVHLGLPGDLTNVDAVPPPFGDVHRLSTATNAGRGDPASARDQYPGAAHSHGPVGGTGAVPAAGPGRRTAPGAAARPADHLVARRHGARGHGHPG